jgi:hypothetical protein
MYRVVYVDHAGVEITLADHLPDRDAAADIAKLHAAQLGVGRMVLAGSVKQRDCVFVLPVDDLARAA